jgi:hypothetical protein
MLLLGRRTSIIHGLVAMLTLTASQSLGNSTQPDAQTLSDSTATNPEWFFGFAVGHQVLHGNDYLGSLLSRYTDTEEFNSSTRWYLMLGGVWRKWVLEGQFGFFWKSSPTLYPANVDGEFTLKDYAFDVWLRRQMQPFSSARDLTIGPGLAVGYTSPRLEYDSAQTPSLDLVDGAGLVLGIGVALEYKIFALSLGLEYQYRWSEIWDVEVSKFVTFPDEAFMSVSGNAVYVTCKLYPGPLNAIESR